MLECMEILSIATQKVSASTPLKATGNLITAFKAKLSLGLLNGGGN